MESSNEGQYSYPEVVSSFYKGPYGPVKMFHLRNNYPLLKREEVNDIRFEHFFPLLVEKFADAIGIELNDKVSAKVEEKPKKPVIKLALEEHKKIAIDNLGSNTEQKSMFQLPGGQNISLDPRKSMFQPNPQMPPIRRQSMFPLPGGQNVSLDPRKSMFQPNPQMPPTRRQSMFQPSYQNEPSTFEANRRKSLMLPEIEPQKKRKSIFQPIQYEEKVVESNYVDQRLRRQSQFSKLPLYSPDPNYSVYN